MVYLFLGFIHPIINYTFYDELENKSYYKWSLILAIIEFIIGVLLIWNLNNSFLNILLIVPVWQLIILKLFKHTYNKVFDKDLHLLTLNGDLLDNGWKNGLLDLCFTIIYMVLPLFIAATIEIFIK